MRPIQLCGRRPCNLFRDEVVMDWDRAGIGGVHGNGKIDATDAAQECA